ncbi:MAG: extracellular solute-binding protein [Planctomycetaceae bacterium]|nr:extracellular solute-binding protein [Planctomycetaceae bacterium]
MRRPVRQNTRLESVESVVPNQASESRFWDDIFFIPAGITESSRWLSAATPPDRPIMNGTHPEGVPEAFESTLVSQRSGTPTGVQGHFENVYRWCRCAQPPATLCHPYRGEVPRIAVEEFSRILLRQSFAAFALVLMALVSPPFLWSQPPATKAAAQPADDPDAPPPEPDESEEFQQLPALDAKPLPSLERLLKGPAVDWIVLIRGTRVLEVEPVSPRPNTLQKLQDRVRKAMDAPLPKANGTDESARNEEKARRRDLNKFNIVLLKNDEDDGEYKIHIQNIRQVIHYEDLMLKRIDLLLNEERAADTYELLTSLQQRDPNWPGIAERRDRLKFVEGVMKLKKKLYEQALAQFDQVFIKNPTYPELERQLGLAIDPLVQVAVTAGDYRRARHFIARLKRSFPNHPVVTRWTQELTALATKELQAATAAEQAGDGSLAVDHAELAVKIWPDGSQFGDGYRRICQRYQRLYVGTLELAVGASSTPVAVERESRLLESGLFEPARMDERLVRYHTRFIQDWEPTDLGRSILFRLKKQTAPWEGGEVVTAGPVVAEIAARLDPTHAEFDERFASYVSGARSLSPFEFSVEFRHAPLRPEALFNFAVPLINTSQTATDAIQTARQRFVRGEVSPERIIYRRALAQPAAGKEYYLGEIVERRYPSYERLWQGWLRGEITFVPRVPLSDLARVAKLPEVSLFEFAQPRTHLIQFHPRHPALRNNSLRRALVYATDRQTILNDAVLKGQSLARGRLTSGPFAIQHSATNSLVSPHRFDTRLAYSMLLAAKKELNGEIPKLRLGVSSDFVEQAAAKMLAKQWETVGIAVEVIEVGPQIPFNAAAEPAPWDMLYRSIQMTEPLTELWPCLTLDTHAKVESLAHLPDWLRQELIAVDQAGDWPSAERQLRRLHRDLWSEVHLIPLWEVSEFMLSRKQLRGLPNRPMFPYQDVERWQLQPWFPKDAP